MKSGKEAFTTLAFLGAGLVLPMIAAHASRKVVGAGYRLVTDEDPPRNPASRDVRWRNAIIWSVVTGAIGGLARLTVRRALVSAELPAEGYDFEEKSRELLD